MEQIHAARNYGHRLVAGLLACLQSAFGLAVSTIGEGIDPTHPFYMAFALLNLATLFAFLLYAFWSPSKPLIMWLWLGALIFAFFAMNAHSAHSLSISKELAGLVSLLIYPPALMPLAICALCQIDANNYSKNLALEAASKGI